MSNKTEIEKIKSEYEIKKTEPTDLERLRALDKKVKFMPNLVSYLTGSIATLIFGVGLTMVLEWKIVVWGVIVAAVGIVPMCLTYYMHKILLAKRKQKYGKEIIALANKLLNEEK